MSLFCLGGSLRAYPLGKLQMSCINLHSQIVLNPFRASFFSPATREAEGCFWLEGIGSMIIEHAYDQKNKRSTSIYKGDRNEYLSESNCFTVNPGKPEARSVRIDGTLPGLVRTRCRCSWRTGRHRIAVILLLAIITGLVAGIVRAIYGGRKFLAPDIHMGWLLLIAVLPQLFTFHLPGTSSITSDDITSIILVSSQILLLIFVWKNLHLPGFRILGFGLVLNLVVIALNGGLMPISPETIHRLSPSAVIMPADFGTRLGSSKDILMSTVDTRLWFLSDRFVLPDWIPNRVAFSLGDIFIAIGAYWLLWVHGNIDDMQAKYFRSTKIYTD